MARERPPGRGCGALRRCVLGAALLLGLRLCAELRPSGSRPPARSAPPGPAPRPPGPHLPPAPGPPRGASRRQVTYVRSGRRAPPEGGGSGTPEPGCCAPRGHPRRKVSCKLCILGPDTRIPLLGEAPARPRQAAPLDLQRSLRFSHLSPLWRLQWWHPSVPPYNAAGPSPVCPSICSASVACPSPHQMRSQPGRTKPCSRGAYILVRRGCE